ncbi:transmembrane and coiled-coil domain protein 3-like isoform X2 [Takifugu flavidus]|uniref:transmembrane and coiled-coil domain protein 3-like isoform X2 n=1 Tax=Takifugu flavidus TaxID=433684 RepID=UPI000298DD40|nr:transmembrane and coiled-coil domain protein 3-like isoform X2 [Takifugu flavidus]|eukprot:XP_003967707.1 PREDICTED: transmembrane and coiled-coil domains protein 3-like [Takifugu rubripes]
MPSANVSVRSLYEVEKYLSGSSRMESNSEGGSPSVPVSMRRGSSENNLDLDLCDGSPGAALGFEIQRSRSCLDNLQQKILKVKEQLKIEQTARDENVAEYLKLLNSADKQQVGRIKQVFEKKNQKSAQNIAQMQKKLEQYHRKMKDSEVQPSPSPRRSTVKHSTIPRESPRELLKDMTGSGRHPTMDKIKTIGPGVSLSPPFFFSKPREFANIIRNKFGSADNIANFKISLDASSPPPGDAVKGLSSSTSMVAKNRYPSDDECSSGSASISAENNGNPEGAAALAEQPQGQSQQPGEDVQSRWMLSLEELGEIRVTQSRLEEDIEELKVQFTKEYDIISRSLQEERFRYERLEDQLSDLSELHQHEMANLKQELASVEERVAYQAQERARDIQEALESCQTRVSKLELQQQHQQQTVQLESHDARVLLGKSINIMLAIITVILVCVSTAAKFAAPLMRSRHHVVATILGVCFLTIFWKNWDRLQLTIDRMLVPA